MIVSIVWVMIKNMIYYNIKIVYHTNNNLIILIGGTRILLEIILKFNSGTGLESGNNNRSTRASALPIDHPWSSVGRTCPTN